MRQLHLILGGARSGKSSYAEKIAETRNIDNQQMMYIATATAKDDEMAARILRHQTSRACCWKVVEEPIHIGELMDNLATPSVVLIDCLTLWLNNCLEDSAIDWHHHKRSLLNHLDNTPHQVYMVSNEIGLGVIPMGEMTRLFVDEIGRLNQEIAEIAESVTFMVAGLPQQLKQITFNKNNNIDERIKQ